MKKALYLIFNSSWLLRKKNEFPLLVEIFSEHFKKIYDVEILEKGLMCYTAVIKKEDESPNEILANTQKILKDVFGVEDINDVCKWDIKDYAEEKKTEKFETFGELLDDISDEKEPDLAANRKAEIAHLKYELSQLIGAEEFKELVNECISVSDILINQGDAEIFARRSYVFAINDGYGLTTYLELFAKAVNKLGLFKINERRPVIEKHVRLATGKDENPFISLYGYFRKNSNDPGSVIMIDISEWMNNMRDKHMRDFLDFLDENKGSNIVVFRVPFVESDVLKGIVQGLNDRLFVKAVSFVPFNTEELNKCIDRVLGKRGYDLSNDARGIFEAKIAEEKSDGRFYGINTVEKIACEMIYLSRLNSIGKEDPMKIIVADDIKGLVSSYEENEKSGLEMLDGYIGMGGIKNKVMEIVSQIEMSLKDKSLGAPCIHMRFVGNPGTGKTTVARIIGKILMEKGVLRNGNFFEYSGRDFCGRYIGETAPKTSAMCRDAYGSVLFIDEAYTLYRSQDPDSRDFGKEAIDTLIAEMENHRKDLVVIMAGYPEDMKTLMKANAGLESRMPYLIEFPNYKRDELFEIFMLMVNRSFKYEEGFEEAVKEYFNSLPDEVLNTKEFSNARFVRNLFERTWGKATLRAQLNKEDKSILKKEDLLAASSENEFKKNVRNNPRRPLGFLS